MILLLPFLLHMRHSSAGDQHHIFAYNARTQEVHSHSMYGSGSIEIEHMNTTFEHAESPRWDPDRRLLYWVDVLAQNVHALDYTTFEHQVKHLECGEVNVVIPILESDNLLIGCQSKVFVMDWNSNTLKEIAHLDSDEPDNILNEGKCDAYGRLWAGTKGPQEGDEVAPDHATLYKLEHPHYKPSSQVKPVTISNGLVWSLNNTLLYYVDSGTNRIEVFDFDLKKGLVRNRRTVLDTAEWGYSNPVPDGMTIDRDGFLWVALFFYGQVLRIDPDAGRIVRVYDLPVPRVTSMTWTGDSLEELVVTSSRRNLHDDQVEEYPLAGTIFMLRGLGTGGVTEHKFTYDSWDQYL